MQYSNFQESQTPLATSGFEIPTFLYVKAVTLKTASF